jgi:DNA-binding Lrp family transcriptional regulator
MVSATGVVIALPAWSSAVASGPYPVPSALSGCQQVPGRYIGRNLPETTAMVPFFVQFKCKLGQSYAVANAIAEAEIASEIYSTAGDYDLLVKFYVDNETDIGHFVNEKVQVIPGIQDTHTIITFKAFGTG